MKPQNSQNTFGESLRLESSLMMGSEVSILDNGLKVIRSALQLGNGTFGVVYKGVLVNRTGQNQDVAIKFAGALQYSPEGNKTLEALQTEETVFGQVPIHKNIIKYLGSKTNAPNAQGLFIVLEYMPQNLKAAIKNDGRIRSYRVLLNIFKGIVQGMIHLQGHGVIHLDLKPENILLDPDLTPKIADFGASKIRHAQSMTAAFRGTLGYMAPESKIGGWLSQAPDVKIKVHAQVVDVYSFGVILWECTTGGQAKNVNEGDNLIVWGGLVPCKVQCNCPEELRNLIEECVRYEISNDSCSKDHGRPRFHSILQRLNHMLETCQWLDDPLPRRAEEGL